MFIIRCDLDSGESLILSGCTTPVTEGSHLIFLQIGSNELDFSISADITGHSVPGVASTPSEDLRYRGGHIIPHLQFMNTSNGIPVFSEPWKNVVATLYHELNEARTDPDVEDAIRNPYDPNAERYLGWTSDRGEECGDYPIEEVGQLRIIVREVPLTDGSGLVPVQFQYSNAVHGPEGPIPQPH